MKTLDDWITGNLGYDHRDNWICPDCGEPEEWHCQECGACIDTDFMIDNLCESCAGLGDYAEDD